MRIPFALLISLLASNGFAVTVSECVDAQGHRSFSDRCQPEAKKVNELKVAGSAKAPSPTISEIAERHPVTLYAVPKCDVCELVRNLLDRRKVPFTEKNVSENPDLQQELKDRAGALTVPTLFIDNKPMTGYNEQQIDTTLTAAGYPNVSAAAATAPAAAATD
jgi:glutaredoxin 3